MGQGPNPPLQIVVLMLENRSFDSALGYLYSPDDPPRNHLPPLAPDETLFHGLAFVDAEKLANQATLHDGSKITQAPVPGVRADNSTGTDPGEAFKHVKLQIYGSPPASEPAMSGFLQDYANVSGGDAGTVRQIMHMYTPADLPVLNTLARGYAVSDLWFASVPSQTNTNRAFSLCGTSTGLVDNGYLTEKALKYLLDDDRFQTDTIWNVLDDHGFKDWKVFWEVAYPPVISSEPYTRRDFPHLEKIDGIGARFEKMDQFFTRAKAGTLPQFSYIEPSWGGAILSDLSILGNDYHPPGDSTPGEVWLQKIYSHLISNTEAWNRTLFVVLFDEHGGNFDHVPPPQPPDGAIPPKPNDPGQYGFGFDRFGVRVPAILISPWIEPRTVFRSGGSPPYDHTSLIATILKLLLPGVDASDWGLGDRVAAAPTFEGVLTRTEPRTDNVFAVKPAPPDGTAIRFGDPFYLKHQSGEFISKAYRGDFYYFPRLAADGQKVVLRFRGGWGEIASGGTVQVRTDEYLTPEFDKEPGFAGIRNFLGAWSGEHDCYYYSSDDAENYGQEYWIVRRVSGGSGPLVYGDKVFLISDYSRFSGQRLTKNRAYVTTASGATDTWTLVPAPSPLGRWQTDPGGTPAVAGPSSSRKRSTLRRLLKSLASAVGVLARRRKRS